MKVTRSVHDMTATMWVHVDLWADCTDRGVTTVQSVCDYCTDHSVTTTLTTV